MKHGQEKRAQSRLATTNGGAGWRREDTGCDAVSKKTFSERLRDRGFAITKRGHSNQTVVLKLVLRNTNGCELMRTDCPVNPKENSIRGGNTENRFASVRTSSQREEEDPFAD